jgi:hypothetical protein
MKPFIGCRVNVFGIGEGTIRYIATRGEINKTLDNYLIEIDTPYDGHDGSLAPRRCHLKSRRGKWCCRNEFGLLSTHKMRFEL